MPAPKPKASGEGGEKEGDDEEDLLRRRRRRKKCEKGCKGEHQEDNTTISIGKDKTRKERSEGEPARCRIQRKQRRKKTAEKHAGRRSVSVRTGESRAGAQARRNASSSGEHPSLSSVTKMNGFRMVWPGRKASWYLPGNTIAPDPDIYLTFITNNDRPAGATAGMRRRMPTRGGKKMNVKYEVRWERGGRRRRKVGKRRRRRRKDKEKGGEGGRREE